MKKQFSVLLLLSFICYSLWAQQKVDAKIENVTVFLNGGQVVRTATATLPNGKSDIIFNGLTPNLDPQSIVVKGEGDFTIMSVKHQMNFLEEIKRKDTIVTLERDRDKLLSRNERLNADLLVIANEEEILQRNRVQIIGIQNNPTKPEDLKTLIEYQIQRLKDIYAQKITIQEENNKIRTNVAKTNNQLSELNARKNTTTAEVVVTVFVKTAPSVNSLNNAKFRLEYVVPNVGWSPLYDLRIKDVTSPVLAQMKAKVRQNSGEDWKDVKLTLSTGEPKRSGIKPELGTWQIGAYGYSSFKDRQLDAVSDFQLEKANRQMTGNINGIVFDKDNKEPLVGASIVVTGTTKGTLTNVDGKFSLDLPPNTQSLTFSFVGYNSVTTTAKSGEYVAMGLAGSSVLSEVVVMGYGSTRKSDATGAVAMMPERDFNVDGTPIRLRGISTPSKGNYEALKVKMKESVKENQKTTTTSFDIELPYTIPTDGKEYQVEIKEVTIPASYQYTCVPKLDPDAFLTAYITDWEQYSLIEGEANLYFEGTYLGKTLLKTQSVEDTLTISLGRDKNVVVKRTKSKEFGEKTNAFSSKRLDTRNFEISVKNKKSVPLSINIEDQVPVATDKSIEVVFDAKGAEYDKDKGHVIWKLTLQPSEDKKINFSYSVKHPNEVRVALE